MSALSLRGITDEDVAVLMFRASHQAGRGFAALQVKADTRDFQAALSRAYETRHSSVAHQVRVRETIMRQIERERGQS